MKVYGDVDSVVADFEMGAHLWVKGPEAPFDFGSLEYDGMFRHFGMSPDMFWKDVYDSEDFYSKVPLYEWSHSTAELFDVFVTSCRGLPNATRSKLKWLERHFPGKPVIVIDNKRLLDYSDAVLVDDIPHFTPGQVLFPSRHNARLQPTPENITLTLSRVRELRNLRYVNPPSRS